MLRKILILFIFFLTFNQYLDAEDIDSLLSGYVQESDLSNITKIDSAGPVQIFTRDDLEKMQVKNLADVINALYGVYLNRSNINTTTFARPVTSKISPTYTRLYINDHDMSSPFFGSAFFIWGEMPVEYIDHIEVYTASSSLEFGNENGSVIFRLYTKTAKRDSGSKFRLFADTKKSFSTNFYTADILENGFNYFAYANIDSYKREKYHNYFKSAQYTFNSDYKGYNIFANLQYNNYSLDIGLYKKSSGNFIGLNNYMGVSLHNTPYNGYFDSKHDYIHLTKKLKNKIKIQLSFDAIETHRDYIDPNGIKIIHKTAPILIKDYNVKVKEHVTSVTIEKRLTLAQHHLLFGSFYKHKAFDYYGLFSTPAIGAKNDFSNTLNFYSLYAEDSYHYDPSFRFIFSVKGDFYRYKQKVKRQNSYLTRIGFVKKSGHFKYKLFYSKSYVALAFFQTYNPYNTPYKSNPDLDILTPNVYTGAINYKKEKTETTFEVSQGRNKSAWVYNPKTAVGWNKKKETAIRTVYQLNQKYTFNPYNRISATISYGRNSLQHNDSPKFEFMMSSFNTYKKFDLYTAFTYKCSYKNYNIKIPNSYDLTSALKYHYSKDLSIGLRGENILNRAYRQAYKHLNYTIPSIDKKYWLNLEYLF